MSRTKIVAKKKFAKNCIRNHSACHSARTFQRPFPFTDNLVCNFQSGDLSSYAKSGEWEIIDFSTEQHRIVYGCCPEPYYDVTYYLKVRRQVMYYAMYFIIPCALIALLAATIFLLPQDCSERITLGKLVESFIDFITSSTATTRFV
jgi:hypothetical protein